MRGLRLCLNLALTKRLDGVPHFLGVRQRAPDISIFRTSVEGDQPVAMCAIDLKPVADFSRMLPKHLRAFRAFYFDAFVDHESPRFDGHLKAQALKAWPAVR
jgi:hypothetical protein